MGIRKRRPGISVQQHMREKAVHVIFTRVDSDHRDMFRTLAEIRGVSQSELVRLWIDREYAEWRDEIRTDKTPTIAHVERELTSVCAHVEVHLEELRMLVETLKLTREFKSDSVQERTAKITDLLRDAAEKKRAKMERIEKKIG